MQQHLRRWFIGLVSLALVVLSGVAAATPAGSVAEPVIQGERWLSFDEGSSALSPTLTLTSSDSQNLVLDGSLPGCTAQDIQVDKQIYTLLDGDGYGHPELIGLPDLPVLRREVEIPFEANVTLELIEAQYTDWSLAELGIHTLYPLQPPIPKLPDVEIPFEIDQAFYASDSLYPAFPLTLGEEYTVRGHRIQQVELWPVAYNPAAGTLRLYKQITFRLQLTGGNLARTQALAERYASPLFEEELAERVLNYNQNSSAVESYVNTQPGYLIITADAYYDAMQPFANLRDSRGFDVTMTRLSDIPGSGTNVDIKTYIQDAYDNWANPPSYVLLVGDTDTIPGWPSQSAGEVTDLYYGTMDGSTDWHPDIGRGRFPVRSEAQTTILVNKYLDYAGLIGQEPWLKKAAFIATCDQYTVAEGTHNYVIDNYTLPGGFTGIFPNNPQPGGDKIYCITYNGTATNIRNAANEGRWAIIYSGHGSQGGWVDGAVSFSQTDVRNLTGVGFFPFVASHACVTNDFEEFEVYGETWVLQDNKGALVFWGSSDNSYWSEDDVLERVMFDSLFAEINAHADVARMTDDGLAAVETAYPSRARYYWETYNVLGDPAVKIFLEPDLPTFTLGVDPSSLEICNSGAVTSTVEIGSIMNYSETVFLETGPLPSGVSADFDPISAQAPYSSVLTLDVTTSTVVGDHSIIITASDQVSWTQDTGLDLRVVDEVPATPILSLPADGATDQALTPTFEWEESPYVTEYQFQLALSPFFAPPLVDAQEIRGTSYTPDTILDGGRCYWWRVQGENGCGEGDWADPFHFATVALGLSFSDDMEAGAGNWSHQANQGVDSWTLSTDQSHSPTHSWHVPDSSSVTDSFLWNSSPVHLGAGSALSFWHRHQFESSYDGSVLEISTNGGSSWTDLGPYITANGYNGTISTNHGNPLGGRSAWVSDLNEWTQVEVDLNSFAGQDVLIRWRIGCDSSISDVGWYIDDVMITSPLPPNPTPTLLSVTPDTGSSLQDTPVQISGSDLITTPSLQLGDTWLVSVTMVSSTTLDAVVPAGMASGTYTLTLYNGDCQEATLANAFTVYSNMIDIFLPVIIKGD